MGQRTSESEHKDAVAGSEFIDVGAGSNRLPTVGPHAGKGPKGYVRSDERIHEDICEALSRHPDIDASEIEVQVSHGEVTLSGTVSERQLKRVAESCVENVAGVRDISNTIRIVNDLQ